MESLSVGVAVQVATFLGTLITGLFAFLRYSTMESAKREKTLLDYFETKNGHMERIAARFSDSMDKNSIVLGDLKTEIRVLSEKNK